MISRLCLPEVVWAAPGASKSGKEASVETGTSVTVAQTEMPSDYYDYMAQMQAQQVFFESLIFGILVFLVFSNSFKK